MAKQSSGNKPVATTKNNKNNTTHNQRLLATLEQTILKLQQSQVQMHHLHSTWRTYLKILSYLVVAMSWHTCQKAVQQCRNDWDQLDHSTSNNNDNASIYLSYLQSPVISAQGIGSLMALLQCLYLSRTTSISLSHPTLLVCHCCLVVVALLLLLAVPPPAFLPDTQQQQQQQKSANTTTTMTTNNNTPLPVGAVFHVIVVLSLWFMQSQMVQLRDSQGKVRRFREEQLAAAKQGKKNQ